jgi:hypothetical protein
VYKEKVALGCEMSKQIGNTYTASVWNNLAYLVSNRGSALAGKNVVLFSYGSGALATMLELCPRADTCTHRGSAFSLARMQHALDLEVRLRAREQKTPAALDAALRAREDLHAAVLPFEPTFSTEGLAPGAFYLAGINAQYERTYARVPALPSLPFPAEPAEESEPDLELTLGGLALGGMSPLRKDGKSSLKRSKTQVFASGRSTVQVVVTGISAALPGRHGQVFAGGRGSGAANVSRIINGENFISRLAPEVTAEMLARNVVQVRKGADGKQERVPVRTAEDSINLAASLGSFSLVEYGVSESIACTMDRAVQVAVAAGLEALKDAGIVSGEGEGLSGWALPESMQSTTGVVYATSFPALDAAIEEVSKYFQSRTLSSADVATGEDLLVLLPVKLFSFTPSPCLLTRILYSSIPLFPLYPCPCLRLRPSFSYGGVARKALPHGSATSCFLHDCSGGD